MPTYVYQCGACGLKKEVFHSMAECDNPTDETLKKISCHYDQDCQISWAETKGVETPTGEEYIFKRVPQAVQIKGAYNGSSVSGAEKRATIKSERRQRSHQDFKKKIYPNLPKSEKRHFEQKWKKNGDK